MLPAAAPPIVLLVTAPGFPIRYRDSRVDDAQFLMDYSEGSFMPILIIALIIMSEYPIHTRYTYNQSSNTQPDIKNAPVPFFLKFITRGIADKVESSFVNPEFKTHCDFLEDYLSKSSGEFFCGDSLTGADVMILFGLEGATQRVPLSETSYPKLYAYVRRMQKRDAYQRAAKRVSEESGEEYVAYSDLKGLGGGE
jgi:hypothetical protein